MQIPAEFLKEKCYEGTRLIAITDETVLKLKKEIAKFRPIAEPHLKLMEEYSKTLDPFYTKIRELDAEKEKIKSEMKPTKELFDVELKEMEAIEQKTDLIKQKLQPLVAALIKDQLGEFETGKQLIEKGDELFVEVLDEIEEKVKLIRASKMKK